MGTTSWKPYPALAGWVTDNDSGTLEVVSREIAIFPLELWIELSVPPAENNGRLFLRPRGPHLD